MSGYYISCRDLLEQWLPVAGVELPGDEILDQVQLQPAIIVRDPVHGPMSESRVRIGRAFELRLPGVDMLYLSFGGDNTPLRVAWSLQPAFKGVLGPVPLAMHFDTPLLRPMRPLLDDKRIAGFEPDPERDAFSVRIDECYLGYSADRGIDVGSRFAVSVPPFEIAGTGLVLGADNATVVYDAGGVDPAIIALGFDSGFRGIYAAQAVLYWLPEIHLRGRSVPGLRLEFAGVAIGNDGVSCTLSSHWPVVLDDAGRIDTTASELVATLFAPQGANIFGGEWQLALERVSGTLQRNVPQAMQASAWLRVPLLDAVLSAAFGMAWNPDSGDYRTTLRLRKESPQPLHAAFLNGALTLRIDALTIEGWLATDGFALSGETSFACDVFGLSVAAEQATLAWTHTDAKDELRFGVSQLELGALGLASDASLLLDVRRTDSGWHFEQIELHGLCSWDTLQSLVPDALKDTLQPPEDARIEARLSWHEDGDGDWRLAVRLHTGLSHLDRLWLFIPPPWRPAVEELESVFLLEYASTADLASSAAGQAADGLTVSLTAQMALRLPALHALAAPGLQWLQLHPGGEDGLLHAEFRADYSSGFEDGEQFSAGLSLSDVMALDLVLPGTQPDAPFVRTRLNRVGLQFGELPAAPVGGDSLTSPPADPELGGSIQAEGEFTFSPLLPQEMPFAAQLQSLLHRVGLDDIRGRARLALEFTESSFELDIHGEFDEAGIEIEVLPLLAALAGGSGGPESDAVEVDFDIGFQLIGFRFLLGYDDSGSSADEDPFRFAFDITVEMSMTGLPPVRAAMTLSDEAFSLTLTDVAIPFELPLYPIDNSDLARLRGGDGRWSSAQLQAYAAELDALAADLGAQLEDANTRERARFRLTKDRLHLELKKLFLQLIMQIHQRIDASGQPLFETLVEADTLAHATAHRMLHVETELKLQFPSIGLHIPFDDPLGIRLEGSGHLAGLADDDPLKPIESYQLGLGLSAEYIYLRLDSDGASIPLPSLGSRYDDGSVSINKLLIGYGYTKNSFALDFAGELILPSALIEDADTSDSLGAGIRLPRYSALAFTLDLIPISIGKVSFILPVPRFDLDLRDPNAPPLLSTARCEPYWDGLQFIVRDVTRVGFKHLAFSPFFGPTITPNLKFDGDLKLGNDSNGLTLIVDDLLVLTGTYVGMSAYLLQIPFFSDPLAPYFQNICANLRAGGFQLNFNLQRPFPSFSPLALIEVFGLISDPGMEIDPRGSLANTIRFSLTDAWFQAPEPVLQMFPEAARFSDRRYAFTLNLGTLISMAQAVVGMAQPVAESLQEFADDTGDALDSLFARITALDSSDFDPWQWIALLPPELRKFRVGGQVAGFRGTACLVLATAEEARAGLRNPGRATPLAQLDKLDGGDRALLVEPLDAPLYRPVSDDFNQAWSGQGQHWTADPEGIVWSGAQTTVDAEAPNLLLHASNDVPTDVEFRLHIHRRFWRQSSVAGLLFAGDGVGSAYELRLEAAFDDQLRLRLLKRGAAAPLELLTEILPQRRNGDYFLVLATYRYAQTQHFELRLPVTEDETQPLSPWPAPLRAVDTQAATGGGRFGLLASGATPLRFSAMRVSAMTVREPNVGQISEESLRDGFDVALAAAPEGRNGQPARTVRHNATATLFRGTEFAAFSDEDLDHLPLDRLSPREPARGGVWIGARLAIAGGQRLRFLGRLFDDGSFALLAAASAKPLRLQVLGLDIAVPFRAEGRLALVGRQRRDGYHGELSGEGRLDWQPIPNVVRIEVGAKQRPCRLSLRSDGHFGLRGDALITLFAGAVQVDGEIDLSHERAAFSGALYYELGMDRSNYPFTHILVLDISGEGRVESLNHYRFYGRGEVTLLGDRFPDIEVFLNEREAEFALRYHKPISADGNALTTLFPVLRRCDIELNGRCRLSLRRTVRPEFVLAGDGRIAAFGAEIRGKGELRSQPRPDQSLAADGFNARVEGTLLWQGRPWLGGYLEVGSMGLSLGGETRFGLQLTPKNLPGLTLELAHLFLDIRLAGEFRVDAASQEIYFLFRGHWTLGAAMADTGSGGQPQVLPLAADRFTFSSNAGINPDQEYVLPLLNMDNFSLLPLGDLNVTLPAISFERASGASAVARLGEIANQSAFHMKTPAGYVGMHGFAPYWNPDEGLSGWEPGSRILYSAYEVNFTTGNTLSLDLSTFTALRVELVLTSDLQAGSPQFPLQLRVITPGGGDEASRSRSFAIGD